MVSWTPLVYSVWYDLLNNFTSELTTKLSFHATLLSGVYCLGRISLSMLIRIFKDIEERNLFSWRGMYITLLCWHAQSYSSMLIKNNNFSTVTFVDKMHSLFVSENNIENDAHNSKDDQKCSINMANDPQWENWVVCNALEWRYTIRPDCSITLIF